jgi:hypothetical protein
LLDLDQAQILELFIANFRQDVLVDNCSILVRCFGSQGKPAILQPTWKVIIKVVALPLKSYPMPVRLASI